MDDNTEAVMYHCKKCGSVTPHTPGKIVSMNSTTDKVMSSVAPSTWRLGRIFKELIAPTPGSLPRCQKCGYEHQVWN